jgi:HAE1 family hydrophobic/amphiphilic exporter-1
VLTTIAVFLPMVFVEGVAGRAFGDLGLAVVLSLLASMLVALFFIPMLASRAVLAPASQDVGMRRLLGFDAWRSFRSDWTAMRPRSRAVLTPYLIIRLAVGAVLELLGKLVLVVGIGPLWALRRFVIPPVALAMRVLWWLPLRMVDGLLGFWNRAYPPMMRWCLAHAGLVNAGMVASMVVTVFAWQKLQSELLPEVHQGEFTIELALPVGTPLEETEAVLAPVEQAILAEKEHIASLIVTVGYDPANTQRSDEGEHTARFKVLLEPAADNARVEELVAGRIRARLAGIPDLEARLTRPVLFSFRTPVEEMSSRWTAYSGCSGRAT